MLLFHPPETANRSKTAHVFLSPNEAVFLFPNKAVFPNILTNTSALAVKRQVL